MEAYFAKVFSMTSVLAHFFCKLDSKLAMVTSPFLMTPSSSAVSISSCFRAFVAVPIRFRLFQSCNCKCPAL